MKLPLLRDCASVRLAFTYGRRTFSKCVGRVGVNTGGNDLETGSRYRLFRCHQKRLLVCEALVFMDPVLAKDLPFIRKRAAQLFSKSRFIACQFDAYLHDGLWLDLARYANAMAECLRNGIINSKHARLAWHAEANEVFCVLDKAHAEQLQEQGAVFYQWNPPRAKPGLLHQHEVLVRLVTSFATETDQVDRFLELLR